MCISFIFKQRDTVHTYTGLIVDLRGKELLWANLAYSHHPLQKTQQADLYHLGGKTKQNNFSKLLFENQTSRSVDVPEHNSAHLAIRLLTPLLQLQQNI